MNHRTIKRDVSRSDRKLLGYADFLNSKRTRLRVWLDARNDAKNDRYGCPEKFRAWLEQGNDSEVIEHFMRLSHVAKTKAEEIFEHESAHYRELLPKVQERHDEQAEKIREIENRAAGTICDDAHLSPAKYIMLLLLFTVTEAAFSIPSLRWSNLGNTAEETVLAVVAAIIIVLLCHFLGKDLRRYPLVVTTPASRRVVIAVKTIGELVVLVTALLTVTYFRWRGMREESGTSDGSDWSTWALFALGCAFAFAAVISAHETEYSGARFGLAVCERRHRKFRDLALAVGAAQENIQKRRQNYSQLLSDKLAALRAAHQHRYVKSWKPPKDRQSLDFQGVTSR